jgi:hypothetical protein
MRKSPLQQISEDYRADQNRSKKPATGRGRLWVILDLISFFGRLFG